MIRSNSCDYSDAYIHVKATVTVPNTTAHDAAVINTNKKVIFKNCAPFTICISEINNTQLDDAQDIDIAMPGHILEIYDSIRYWPKRALFFKKGTNLPPVQSLFPVFCIKKSFA